MGFMVGNECRKNVTSAPVPERKLRLKVSPPKLEVTSAPPRQGGLGLGGGVPRTAFAATRTKVLKKCSKSRQLCVRPWRK